MNAKPQIGTNRVTKGKPLPVRFGTGEDDFLHTAARETGLNVSELVRRSVRLMRRQHALVNGFSFVVDLSS